MHTPPSPAARGPWKPPLEFGLASTTTTASPFGSTPRLHRLRPDQASSAAPGPRPPPKRTTNSAPGTPLAFGLVSTTPLRHWIIRLHLHRLRLDRAPSAAPRRRPVTRQHAEIESPLRVRVRLSSHYHLRFVSQGLHRPPCLLLAGAAHGRPRRLFPLPFVDVPTSPSGCVWRTIRWLFFMRARCSEKPGGGLGSPRLPLSRSQYGCHAVPNPGLAQFSWCRRRLHGLTPHLVPSPLSAF